ncbi:MAG: hypothetical protein ABJP45_14100 [Cyclobacteriaceae bacterium]
MLDKELKDIWRNSSQKEKIKFDLSRLLIDLNTKMEHLEKTIRRRDFREITACVIGFFLFGYFAYEIPFPITKAACIFAMFYFLYVVYRIKKAERKDSESGLSLSFRDQLVSRKIHLTRQADLLNSVLYWYVLPPFIMNIVFILGLGDPTVYHWEPRLLHLLPLTTPEKIKTIIILALFYSLIVWLNKRAVQKTLNPAIQEVKRVLKELENDLKSSTFDV